MEANPKRLASRGRTREMNEELEAGDREEAAVCGGGRLSQGRATGRRREA